MPFPAIFELSSLATGDGSEGFVLNGASGSDYSGHSVSAAGDVNGDGIGDLIIGTYAADPNGSYSGASYVVFGRDGDFDPAFELASLSGGDGSKGFVINGVSDGDRSGWSVSGAGDVNGDSIADLIVGAVNANTNNGYSGASYVVFGHSEGDLFDPEFELASLSVGDGSTGFVINGGTDGDQSGRSVSDAGDVNGDRIADLIVGANQAGTNGYYSGASYVVFGRSDGDFDAVIDLSSLSGDDGSEGFVINGVSAYDRSGWSVSAAGDVNGDGIDDLIVGAVNARPNGDYSGASYVLFGRSDGDFDAVIDLSSLSGGDGSTGFVINGASGSDQSGRSVSAAGDVNGDGIDDLIVGAYTADPNGSTSGASYVVFGRGDGDFDAVIDLSSLSGGDGSKGFVINGASDFNRSGASVSAAGDVNGDGIDDLIIGAVGAEPHGSYSGASYVVFGHSEGVPFDPVFELSSLSGGDGSKGFVINGVAEDDRSGGSVSAAGDVNNDGLADLIIGADKAAPNGAASGASYVVFGRKIPPTVDDAGTVADDTPTITGTAILREDEELTVTVGGRTYTAGDSNLTLTGTAWSLTIPDDHALDDDTYDVTATITDTSLGTVTSDTTEDELVIDTAPTVESSVRQDPTAAATNADSVTFRVTFDQPVVGVDAADFALSGTAASGATITSATAVGGSGEIYDVVVGGIAEADGTLNLDIAAGVDVADTSSNALTSLAITGADESYTVDNTAPPPTSPPISPPPPAPPNQAPVASDDAYAVDRNGLLTVAGPGPLANDGDPDGDALFIAGLADGPDHGVVAWTAEGGFTYQPDAGFSGTDRFIYQVGDGQGGEDTATVAIRVRGNLPPAPVTGGFGNERLAGTNQAETISGMDGNDTISGDGGRDRLNGNAGDDVVEGGPGEDVVWGGQGNDLVLGGEGSDWVLGDRGDDVVHGGKGRDQVWGGQGHDRLFGDDGDDRLSGDLGNDTLTGGPGADRFVYSEGGGLDRILDHDLMGGDVIELAVGPDGLLNGIAIGSVEDILARLVDGPEGAYLSLGDGQGILIQGIARGQLSADDFMIG